MELTKDQACELTDQIQQAHRLCAGFYKRLFPALNNLGNEIQCVFKNWEPILFSKPNNSKANPGNKWAWDFLPMVGTQFVYSSGTGESTDIGEIILEIQVFVDGALHKDFRKKHGIIGQPDPTTLPTAESYLLVYVYRATERSREEIHELWRKCKYPNIGIEHFADVGDGLEAVGIKYLLSDFLIDENGLISIIKSLAELDASLT